MSGYSGWAISNNAVEAYYNGEKPLSKWKKSDIIEAIENAVKEEELTLNCSIEKLNKMPLKILKSLCLSYSSWHHTSNHYNKTDFYSLDVENIAELTDEIIDNKIANNKSGKKTELTEERWKCAFLEWGGTRKHPKATEVIEEGIVKGDWFYRKDGSKKRITANGFKFIEKIGG